MMVDKIGIPILFLRRVIINSMYHSSHILCSFQLQEQKLPVIIEICVIKCTLRGSLMMTYVTDIYEEKRYLRIFTKIFTYLEDSPEIILQEYSHK